MVHNVDYELCIALGPPGFVVASKRDANGMHGEKRYHVLAAYPCLAVSLSSQSTSPKQTSRPFGLLLCEAPTSALGEEPRFLFYQLPRSSVLS
jgi:hypothetical protein